MKFTFFGLTVSSSWGNGHATPYRAILRALARMGHDVVFYEKDVPYYATRRDLPTPDFCELVLYEDWETIRNCALNDVRDSDVVFNASYCPDGSRLCDEVLSIDGPLHVFYDLDTPITLENLGRGDLEYLRADQVPQFELYLSFTGGTILQELESSWGAKMAAPLYGCVDPDVHRPVASRTDFNCLMSYMGTYAADRQHKVDQLFLEVARRRSRSRFVLAGSLYPSEWQWPLNMKMFEHLAPSDHPTLYSSSQFTLNITRDGMARSGYCPSGRFFEAAACGTPIISDSFRGLHEFFAPGEEIFVVNNADDVEQALDYDPSELKASARRAKERTLSEHTGDRRAQQLLRYVEQARADRVQVKIEVAP